MTGSVFLALVLCAVCFYLLGYRWGMRDKQRDDDDQVIRIAKERDYWNGIATRTKNELLRLQLSQSTEGPPITLNGTRTEPTNATVDHHANPPEKKK